MKNIYYLSIISVFILSVFASPRAYAAPLHGDAVLAFEDLGMKTDMVLHGPFGAGSIRFDLPPTWMLMNGSELDLVISSYFVGENGATGEGGEYLGAALDVYFNDRLQQTLSLQSGTNLIYKVPITAEDLQSPYSDGWHKVSFVLNAAIDCDFDFHQTTVEISMASQAALFYSEVPLPLALHRLPWPIYQQRVSVPDSAAVILPSNPSDGELQAAMTVMASFGRMTGGNLSTSLITVDQLTEDVRTKSHLVFVGKAEGLVLLSDIPLPIEARDNRFVSSEMQENDGILELAISPWNQNKAVLVVGGNSDAGVIKAAQTLSTGKVFTSNDATHTLIAEVNPLPVSGIIGADSAVLLPPDFGFSELGFETITLSELGINWFSYDFYVAPGQVPVENPILNIVYSHSALIDTTRSEASVYFNDTLAGSISLSDQESNLVSSQVKLPINSMKPGLNNISIAANLIPRDNCSITSISGLWMSIYSESSLHLPLAASVATSFQIQDLSNFPSPFINDPSLQSTLFVLPKSDQNAWAVAGNIAYMLGENSTGAIIDLAATIDGNLPEDVETRDIIMIGLPSELQIAEQFTDSMPAYFESDSNIAVLKNQQVVYRISADKDLGYLQLFPSPLGQERVVLGILGTTPNGLTLAGNALVESDIRELLGGNFAAIDENLPMVIDTRTGAGLGRVETNMESAGVTTDLVSTPSPINADTPVNYEGQRFILFGMIGIVVLMALVSFIAVRMRRKTE